VWAFQSLPKGGYVVPSDGPPGLGEGFRGPNFRVDFVNASSGRWVMATESSTALTHASHPATPCEALSFGWCSSKLACVGKDVPDASMEEYVRTSR
jgi:hypothetical protein